MNELYWILWGLVVLLSANALGFFLSYAIVIGKLFNWFLRNDRATELNSVYPLFRVAEDPVTPYIACLASQMIASMAFLACAFVLQRANLLTLLPTLAIPAFLAIHFGSGLGASEKAVLTGTASEDETTKYLRLNIPLHRGYAIIMGLAAVSALRAPFV